MRLAVAQGEVFGLSEAEAEALFPNYDDGNEGSLVSGNSIVMPEGAEGATIVAAAGGGLAVMALNADQNAAGATYLSNTDVLNNSVQVSNVTSDAGISLHLRCGGRCFPRLDGRCLRGRCWGLRYPVISSSRTLPAQTTISTNPALAQRLGVALAVLSDSNPTDGADDSVVGLSWLAEIKYAVTDPGFGLPQLGPIGSFDSEARD